MVRAIRAIRVIRVRAIRVNPNPNSPNSPNPNPNFSGGVINRKVPVRVKIQLNL